MLIAAFRRIEVVIVLGVIVKRTMSGPSLPENHVLCGIEYVCVKQEE
jgi:flagellar biosynthesis protein FliP